MKRLGIDDVPEVLSTYVLTPKGEQPNEQQRTAASGLAYRRCILARKMCLPMLLCTAQLEHTYVPAGDGEFDVDEYKVACTRDCTFQLEPMREIGIEAG